MKTGIWQTLLATALLGFTPAGRSDDTNTPKPVTEASRAIAQSTAGNPVQVDAASGPDTTPAKVSPTVQTQPAVDVAPASAVQGAKPSLPPVLDQVVRLGKSGTDEAVIRAYVEKAASPYVVTGNDIIQLQELGVSKGTIMALIDHSKSTVAAESTATPPPAPAAPQANATVAPPATDAASDYRDALAPYGNWANLPGYGWCWQPTAVVVNPAWRPYCDNGSWLWSDYGWYWNSYYSWGWAPFHYGRWFCHSSGWYWCPDRVWGPSWVCWRNSATHCGWAPLPPGACFTAGVGWTYHGSHVGVSFGFGLGAAQFTFVAHDKFTDHHVSHHAVSGHDAFHHSTVNNNYAVGANNRIVNQGIGRETIAAATGAPIRETPVRDLTRGGNQFAMPTRMNRVATTTSTAPANSQRVASGNSLAGVAPNRSAANATSQAGFRAANPVFNQGVQSRSTMANRNTVMRSFPASGASRIQTTPSFRNGNAPLTSRSISSGYRNSAQPNAPAPMRSFAAPTAQRSFAGSSFAARPMSGGATHSGASVSRGAMASAGGAGVH